MTEAGFAAVRDRAAAAFGCGPGSPHGPAHWRNVERNGIALAAQTGADVEVTRLFALLHDCCRRDDGLDPGHGHRAARHIRQIAGAQAWGLDRRRMEALLYAVDFHAAGEVSADPTVGTCWDADRLDLGRVGIVPQACYMSTDAGRRRAASPARPDPAA